MHKPGSHLHFKVMAFMFRLRDILLPRKRILLEVGIQPGFHILDYGCGSGSYLIPLAELVEPSGKIYALDAHPLAVQMVQNTVSRKRLKNVDAILSDCKTGLQENSIDVVLLYDTFHDLNDPDGVLKELHRVLKPSGSLSLREHHMKENEMISRVTDGGLFRLSKRTPRTFTFEKQE